METATITIQRSSQFMNAIRKIHIYMDKKELGEIVDGEVTDFTVPSGKIKITARVDWAFAQINLDLNPGQKIKLNLFSPIKGWRLLFVLFLIFLPKYVIKFNIEIKLYIVIGMSSISLLLNSANLSQSSPTTFEWAQIS
jgi:hypothetical protein